MTLRRLIAQLVVWALMLAVINIAMVFASENAVPRQVVRSIDASGPVTDLFAGNSLAAAGFDRRAYEQAWPGAKALNIGLGATYPVEHDILIRRALRLTPTRVFYGFFDAGLTGPTSLAWKDITGNRTMVYYVDLPATLDFVPSEDRAQALELRFAAAFPMLADRFSPGTAVEKWRRRLNDIGVPPAKTNRFGRVDDFAQLETSDEAVLRNYYVDVVNHRDPLSPPIQDIIERVRMTGAILTMVEMPLPSRHHVRFYETPEWRAYQQYVIGQLRETGVQFIDASEWISDDKFFDSLHLNPDGAGEFSTRLAVQVSRGGVEKTLKSKQP